MEYNNDSDNSVLYDEDYDATSFGYLSFCKSIDSKNTTSRENSYKSQNYMDNAKKEIKKKKSKEYKKLQKNNITLKYNLVMEEIKINNIKNILFKLNYRLVLEELKNKELQKYYSYGIIYTKFLKSLEAPKYGTKEYEEYIIREKEYQIKNKINEQEIRDGKKKFNISFIDGVKRTINIFKKNGSIETANKLESLYKKYL